MHHRLRQRISARIGELGLKPDIAAVLRAVTVADKSAINEQLWGLFQQFGINHLLVISGLHVGLVAGMGYLFGAALARLFVSSRYSGASLPGLCALLAAFLFAALAGFSLPAVRALCMLTCVLTAVWSGRLTIAWSHLLLAALVVLLLNPLAAIGSGFWLSFGSVAGLLWYLCWRRYVGRGRALVGTHVYMALLMLPFGALFFQGASLVGALGNFIMIPLVGWIIVPAALSASASYLLGLPFDTVLWRCAAWPLEQILPLAAMLAERGGSWIYLSREYGATGDGTSVMRDRTVGCASGGVVSHTQRVAFIARFVAREAKRADSITENRSHCIRCRAGHRSPDTSGFAGAFVRYRRRTARGAQYRNARDITLAAA